MNDFQTLKKLILLNKKKMGQNSSSIKFTSLKKQEEKRREYSASLSPLKRLQRLHELVIKAYGITDKRSNFSNRIYIHRTS